MKMDCFVSLRQDSHEYLSDPTKSDHREELADSGDFQHLQNFNDCNFYNFEFFSRSFGHLIFVLPGAPFLVKEIKQKLA